MIKFIIKSLLCLTILFQASILYGKIRLPRFVGDSMVIQRDTKVKIWGWADANEKIKIKFKGKNYATTTSADGKWVVWLPPTHAGGPYSMDITGNNTSLKVMNIMVGDVWVCAGQSNMVHYLDL